MAGETLHNFDLSLCVYALDNIRGYMDRPAFARYIEEQLDPPVLAYLLALGDDPSPAPLLLSDRELRDLASTFEGGPQKFDRPWIPYVPLHRRSIDCVAEIRSTLAMEYAEEWARASVRFSKQLEEERTLLSGSIQVIHE